MTSLDLKQLLLLTTYCSKFLSVNQLAKYNTGEDLLTFIFINHIKINNAKHQTFKNLNAKPPPSLGNQDTTRNQNKGEILIVQLVVFASQIVYRH